MIRSPWLAMAGLLALAVAGADIRAGDEECCCSRKAKQAAAAKKTAPACYCCDEECAAVAKDKGECPCSKGTCKCSAGCTTKCRAECCCAAGACECCEACKKTAKDLPKCCCPPGTKCASGCTPDACCCKKDSTCSCDITVNGEIVGKICIGGCVMEMTPMPQQESACALPRIPPPLMPFMMLMENLCPCPAPPGGLMPVRHMLPPPPPPPVPFPGMGCGMPAGCCGIPCDASGSCVELVHKADGIHVCSPYIEKCVCDKVSLCAPGCLMLEGNVQLVCTQDGGKVEMKASKVCLCPQTGRIQIQPSAPANDVMPAGFFLKLFE